MGRFGGAALSLLLALMLSLWAAGQSRASTLPGQQVAAVEALAQQGWQPLGSGALRWFGLRIYEATLWAPEPFSWREGGPFALAIAYERSIPSARLVKATEDEMLRLGLADAARIATWRPALEQAFPDVSPGDVIVGIHRPGEGVFFHYGDRPSGIVTDPDFAVAFFAIWLDERTREPGLRARLIGDRTDG
jgi:hypothetical protein